MNQLRQLLWRAARNEHRGMLIVFGLLERSITAGTAGWGMHWDKPVWF